MFVPIGVYEYVIARTRYIDAAFEKALAERYHQILLFGAGFDLGHYGSMRKRGIPVSSSWMPPRHKKPKSGNTEDAIFVSHRMWCSSRLISTGSRFPQAGCGRVSQRSKKSLHLEGLLMYFDPESIRATFQTIQGVCRDRQSGFFDYIQASVLRHGNRLYGE